jgi:hypothetical protein
LVQIIVGCQRNLGRNISEYVGVLEKKKPHRKTLLNNLYGDFLALIASNGKNSIYNQRNLTKI